jgi:Meckel syndrome type 1 protein
LICLVEIGKWPLVFFQVNSTDSWERFSVEGYGFLELPNLPGTHNLTIKTWRPKPDLFSQIHSFFLGGALKLKDMKELAATYFAEDHLVHFSIF